VNYKYFIRLISGKFKLGKWAGHPIAGMLHQHDIFFTLFYRATAILARRSRVKPDSVAAARMGFASRIYFKAVIFAYFLRGRPMSYDDEKHSTQLRPLFQISTTSHSCPN
jgi:hypothetical protein